MGAALGAEEKKRLFNEIIEDMSMKGHSLRKALENRMSSQTFYDYLESDVSISKRYTRACEDRAEMIADETIEIADSVGNDLVVMPDGQEVENHKVIARDRLRVETRKWLLAKLHPKKYGEKISQEITGLDGKDLIPAASIDLTLYTDDELRYIAELQRKGRASQA
jgi:hypothetical protein